MSFELNSFKVIAFVFTQKKINTSTINLINIFFPLLFELNNIFLITEKFRVLSDDFSEFLVNFESNI